jgi:hypothetical protein
VNGCSAVSSPYNVNVVDIPPVDICIVSVDSATGKNIIVWDNPHDPAISGYLIYKEDYQSLFNPVGRVASDSFSVYIDHASNPEQKSEAYVLEVIDTCGDTIPSFNSWQTIHLNIDKGIGNSWNLIWDNAYSAFPTCYIYRGLTDNTLQKIDSISTSNTSYTDINPPGGVLYYEVGILNPSGCSPSRSIDGYSWSLSNVASTISAGIDELKEEQLRIYPNPVQDRLTIQLNNMQPEHISIFNVNGSKVYEEKYQAGGQVDVSTFCSGIYFLQINTATIVSRQKFIKL